jgi:hypothetical protein
MSERGKWDQAVQKLIALTEQGELKWSDDPFAKQRQREDTDIVGKAFHTDVEGRSVSVYEYTFGEHATSGEPESDVAIEFVNGPKLLWRWPQTLHRWDLLEAVRGQDVGAGEFLEHFLAGWSPEQPQSAQGTGA